MHALLYLTGEGDRLESLTLRLTQSIAMVKRTTIPNVQARMRSMLAKERRLTLITARREKKSGELELKFREFLAQADKLTDAGKKADARKMQEKAQQVLEQWQALQPEPKK